MTRAPVFGIVALLAGAASADAQHDATASSWRDSLARVAEQPVLQAIERDAITAVRASSTDPVLMLRLAFTRLRMAEVSGSVIDFERAVGDFEEVVETAPSLASGWLGLGLANLAFAGAADARVVAITHAFGRSPTDRAGAAWARAIALDSTAAVASFVATASLHGRTTARSVAALNALRRSVPLARVTAHGALVARARVEREFGSLDSALVAIELAARQEDDPSTLLDLAHTRLVMGRLDGNAPWYAGLERAAGDALGAYRRDLVLVLPDSVMTAFDAAAPAERTGVVRNFWSAQDPDGLPAHAERLRAHYQRLHVARRDFALAAGFVSDGFADLTDDRGRIMVLHGAPDERGILTGVVGMPPSESWSYRLRDGGEMLFHFLADSSAAPFYRVESLIDLLARSNQVRWFSNRIDASGRDTSSTPMNTYGAEWSAVVAQHVLLSRWNVSSVYREMLSRGLGGAAATQAAERVIGQRSLAAGASWELAYELPLEARVNVLAVAPDARGPNLQVAFAIAGRSLRPVPTSRGTAFEVRLRASVRALDGRVVAAIDTVRTFVARTGIAPGAWLLGRLPIAVPPGTYVVQVALENDGRGLRTGRDTVLAAEGARGRLAMSDLALGTRSVALAIRTDQGDSAWINPLRSFRAHEPMQLHYEVTGLDAGTAFRSSLRIIRKAGGGMLGLGGAAMLSLGFAHEHGGGVEQIQREIDLRRLRPGDYILEVTVSAPGDQQVIRRQEFSIVR